MSTPFPIYLDNAASTVPHPEVIAASPQRMRNAAINPASGYPAATKLRQELTRARDTFLAKLGIDDARIVWTSGATEANNLAIGGLLQHLGTSALCLSPGSEHASVRAPLAVSGRETRPLPINHDGTIDFDALPAVLDPKVRLVAITAAHNETGAIPDLPRLRRCLNQLAPRARLHVDGAQACGKLAIPWATAGIDMLALTGHKIHGPGGTGCLLIRKGVQLTPLLHGGGQQNGLRSGSLDAVGILGFCQAVELAVNKQVSNLQAVSSLADELWSRLAAADLPPWVRLSPKQSDRHSPYVCAFAFPGLQGAVIVRMLGERGIMVSSGSACAAASSKPSDALLAMGIPADTALGAVRVSFAATNTKTDVQLFVEALADVLRSW